MAEPLRLLVVCLGNICRSPVAEGVLRQRLEEARIGHRVVVDSAGTGGWHAGEPPDRRSIANARRHGVDISALRARQLRDADYRDFDWLLCADRENLADVRGRAPGDANARSALLLEWAGLGEGVELPDPYTGGEAAFEQVWQLVDRAAHGIVARVTERRLPIGA